MLFTQTSLLQIFLWLLQVAHADVCVASSEALDDLQIDFIVMFETTAPDVFKLLLNNDGSEKGMKNDAISVQHREFGNQLYQKNNLKVILNRL